MRLFRITETFPFLMASLYTLAWYYLSWEYSTSGRAFAETGYVYLNSLFNKDLFSYFSSLDYGYLNVVTLIALRIAEFIFFRLLPSEIASIGGAIVISLNFLIFRSRYSPIGISNACKSLLLLVNASYFSFENFQLHNIQYLILPLICFEAAILARKESISVLGIMFFLILIIGKPLVLIQGAFFLTFFFIYRKFYKAYSRPDFFRKKLWVGILFFCIIFPDVFFIAFINCLSVLSFQIPLAIYYLNDGSPQIYYLVLSCIFLALFYLLFSRFRKFEIIFFSCLAFSTVWFSGLFFGFWLKDVDVSNVQMAFNRYSVIQVGLVVGGFVFAMQSNIVASSFEKYIVTGLVVCFCLVNLGAQVWHYGDISKRPGYINLGSEWAPSACGFADPLGFPSHPRCFVGFSVDRSLIFTASKFVSTKSVSVQFPSESVFQVGIFVVDSGRETPVGICGNGFVIQPEERALLLASKNANFLVFDIDSSLCNDRLEVLMGDASYEILEVDGVEVFGYAIAK